MKKIVIAPDSFKGTFSSVEICEILKKTLIAKYPGTECNCIPIADGGEGTTDAFLYACSGEKIPVRVHNPVGSLIDAYYGILPDNSAVIEMAQASGITLINPLAPLEGSTFGTGEMILDALNRSVRKIYIGIGGSATTDGGTGCLCALGVKFLDENGNELYGNGENLAKIRKIDLSGLDKRISETEISVLCDVENPLFGPNGAAYVFARQKGADESQIAYLNNGLENLSIVTKNTIGIDNSQIKGTGAAGGLGFALLTFLGAEMKSGIDTVLDVCRFDDKIKGADLIITGEGKMDSQSLRGKVPFGVAKRACSIPITAIVGLSEVDEAESASYGISRIIETNPLHLPFDEIKPKCLDMLEAAARLI